MSSNQEREGKTSLPNSEVQKRPNCNPRFLAIKVGSKFWIWIFAPIFIKGPNAGNCPSLNRSFFTYRISLFIYLSIYLSRSIYLYRSILGEKIPLHFNTRDGQCRWVIFSKALSTQFFHEGTLLFADLFKNIFIDLSKELCQSKPQNIFAKFKASNILIKKTVVNLKTPTIVNCGFWVKNKQPTR